MKPKEIDKILLKLEESATDNIVNIKEHGYVRYYLNKNNRLVSYYNDFPDNEICNIGGLTYLGKIETFPGNLTIEERDEIISKLKENARKSLLEHLK